MVTERLFSTYSNAKGQSTLDYYSQENQRSPHQRDSRATYEDDKEADRSLR